MINNSNTLYFKDKKPLETFKREFPYFLKNVKSFKRRKVSYTPKCSRTNYLEVGSCRNSRVFHSYLVLSKKNINLVYLITLRSPTLVFRKFYVDFELNTVISEDFRDCLRGFSLIQDLNKSFSNLRVKYL